MGLVNTLSDPNTQAVNVGASFSYSTQDGAGGIFITKNNVTEKYLEDSWLADAWMEKNGPKIANDIPPTRDRGVWIVTRTFAAPERYVAVLKENGEEASLSINADAYKVGKVETTASWWSSYNGSMWKYAEHVSLLCHLSGTMLTRLCRKTAWFCSWLVPTTSLSSGPKVSTAKISQRRRSFSGMVRWNLSMLSSPMQKTMVAFDTCNLFPNKLANPGRRKMIMVGVMKNMINTRNNSKAGM